MSNNIVRDFGSWETFTTSSPNEKLPEPTEEIRTKWIKEQEELRKQVKILPDTKDNNDTSDIQRIAGVDISFVKESELDACVAVVVLEYPSMRVLYEGYDMVKLNEPYIPGFLAFRESPFFVQVIKRIPPEFMPQLIVVDGNGVLHYRGCGSASHLGVLLGIPTVGVAKKFLNVGGLVKEEVEAAFAEKCGTTPGSYMLLCDTTSGAVLGAAVRPPTSKNPLYVSVGHMISLKKAISVVLKCCVHRIPEPTRQADLCSRKFLRDHNYN